MPARTQLNCFEFHRDLLADARRLGAEAVEHGETCAACAEFAVQLMRLKSELTTATCVPVPEGLADRVLLNHGLSKAGAQNWLALAASLVLPARIWRASKVCLNRRRVSYAHARRGRSTELKQRSAHAARASNYPVA